MAFSIFLKLTVSKFSFNLPKFIFYLHYSNLSISQPQLGLSLAQLSLSLFHDYSSFLTIEIYFFLDFRESESEILMTLDGKWLNKMVQFLRKYDYILLVSTSLSQRPYPSPFLSSAGFFTDSLILKNDIVWPCSGNCNIGFLSHFSWR